MTAKDVYKPPFYADGGYIWSSEDVMSLMATDCHGDPEKLMERVCEILNGESESVGNPNITHADGEIYNGQDIIMCVRGYGHLTGIGGLNLSSEEALAIQDEFAHWVVTKLRNDKE